MLLPASRATQLQVCNGSRSARRLSGVLATCRYKLDALALQVSVPGGPIRMLLYKYTLAVSERSFMPSLLLLPHDHSVTSNGHDEMSWVFWLFFFLLFLFIL